MSANLGEITAPPGLGDLLPIRELQSRLQHIFHSIHSIEWQLRTNKLEYIESGALVKINGRWFVRPAEFERVALEIGARKARAEGGGT